MDGKIGLEEHFSFEDTIEDSNGFLDLSVWPELKSRLLDFNDKRLKFMDKYGMEVMILSLNAPAVQGIPNVKKAIEIAPDRILFTSDYPFEGIEEATLWFDNTSISERDRAKIGKTNSNNLFKLNL